MLFIRSGAVHDEDGIEYRSANEASESGDTIFEASHFVSIWKKMFF